MRLSLSLILIVVLGFIGLGWLFDEWYDARLAPRENPALQSYKSFGQELVKLLASDAVDHEKIERWTKSTSNRIQITRYEDFPIPTDLTKNFEQGDPLVLESTDNLSIHFFVPQKNLVLSVNADNLREQQGMPLIRWVMTLVFYGVLILVLWLWLYPLLKRLNELRAKTLAFGRGDLSARIQSDTRSYIADIEQEFNRMAQQIESLVEDNKLLTRGLSHDLRTPIARLRFGLDVLHEANLNEQQQKTLSHLNRDLVAMESMVEQLLNYARLDQAKISLNFEWVDLNLWVKQWCDEHFGQRVDCRILGEREQRKVRLDKYFFAQLLDNLIQNALRYGRGRVQITIELQSGAAAVFIEDDGEGIPREEYKNVLKPFYRVAGEKTKQGYGLGLAFADRIAHWHKLELSLSKSDELGGLRVSLVFPTN